MTQREISFLGAGFQVGLTTALFLAGYLSTAVITLLFAAFILRDIHKPEPK